MLKLLPVPKEVPPVAAANQLKGPAELELMPKVTTSPVPAQASIGSGKPELTTMLLCAVQFSKVASMVYVPAERISVKDGVVSFGIKILSLDQAQVVPRGKLVALVTVTDCGTTAHKLSVLGRVGVSKSAVTVITSNLTQPVESRWTR